MNWIDRAIAFVSPEAALRRLRAREALRRAVLGAQGTPQAAPQRKARPDNPWTPFNPNGHTRGGGNGPNNWQ